MAHAYAYRQEDWSSTKADPQGRAAGIPGGQPRTGSTARKAPKLSLKDIKTLSLCSTTHPHVTNIVFPFYLSLNMFTSIHL